MNKSYHAPVVYLRKTNIKFQKQSNTRGTQWTLCVSLRTHVSRVHHYSLICRIAPWGVLGGIAERSLAVGTTLLGLQYMSVQNIGIY